MNNDILMEIEGSLTERNQTTIPASVRKALHLKKNDKIRYVIKTNGDILVQNAKTNNVDPALSGFLKLLETDIAKHPKKLQPLGLDRVAKMDSLVENVEVDLDAPLADEGD